MMRRSIAVVSVVVLLGAGGYAPVAQAGDARDAVLHDYLAANGMLNRGLYELAAIQYRKFLAEHEDHEKATVARYGLGVSLFRMRQYDAAVAELTRLSKLSHFEIRSRGWHNHRTMSASAEAPQGGSRGVQAGRAQTVRPRPR